MQPTVQQEADYALVRRIAGSEQGAFAELYDRLSGPLYSLALKMTGDVFEAQEALQDVFVQIWRRAATYDPAQSSVFSWAVLQTRSRVIDRLRARGRRARVITLFTDEKTAATNVAHASAEPNAADTLALDEEAARIRAMFDDLPAEQREAIELAFFSDMTHQQIAERLQEPLGTIKARIRRGLLKLREQMRTE